MLTSDGHIRISALFLDEAYSGLTCALPIMWALLTAITELSGKLEDLRF
jgi:hypothetical protein